MSTIPEKLEEERLLYDALAQAGVLSGGQSPSLEKLMEMTGMKEKSIHDAIKRSCNQKLLQLDGSCGLMPPTRPVQIHYSGFRSFQQMLEYPEGSITAELVSAETIEADAGPAESLKIPNGEKIIQLRRIYYRDHRPFAHERYDVRYALLKNTPLTDMGKIPLLQIIQKNLPPTVDSLALPELVQSQYFSLTHSSVREVEMLNLQIGAPVFYIGGRVYHQDTPLCSFTIRVDAQACAFKNQALYDENSKALYRHGIRRQ